MRQDPEHFGDEELCLVYVARKLKEALRLEAWLTDAGIDYAVEPDKYKVGTLFPRERIGAFFYVPPDREAAVREAMQGAGFTPFTASAAGRT